MSPLRVGYKLLVLALAVFLPASSTARVRNGEDREGRWMWGDRKTITETVYASNKIEMYSPSSCYVLETKLPKCASIRRRRDIKIDATPTVPILSTKAPVLEDIGGDNALGGVSLHRQSRQHADGFVLGSSLDPSSEDIQYPTYGMTPGSDDLSRYGRQAVAAPEKKNVTVEDKGNSTVTVEPTAMGWLEYFYLKDITTTITKTTDSTQWFVDPSHMVTFSVRGCEPSVMPFDMAKCLDPYLGPKKNAAIIDAGNPNNSATEDAKSVTNTPVSKENSPINKN